MCSRTIIRTIALAGLALSIAGRCPAQVPAAYQDLYTQLNDDIDDFQGKIATLGNGSTYAVTFSGQLTVANGNSGPALLNPSTLNLVQSEIAQLKNLGVKAISVEVSFPMLYAPFFTSIGHPEYQSQFATFYANVASAIRAQGLAVIVESQSLIPTGLQSAWGTGLQTFYSSFTALQSYENARAQTVQLVAQTMKPDYFILQEEPDTEASQSGQSSLGTVASSTGMLDLNITAARQANVPGMKVGAGFGTWLQAFQLFTNSFTQQQCGKTVSGPDGPVTQPCVSQPLDFLDMHLFPITENAAYCSPPPNPRPCTAPNFWQNALTVVSTANAAKVPMAISQTWLRKVRDREWTQIDGDVQEAREAYSFWAPLDLQFLQAVSNLANYGRMLFVVPFNTQNFFAYLAWSGGGATCAMPACTALQGEGGGNTPQQVFGAAQSAGLAGLAAGAYTSVGTGYQNLIGAPALTIKLSAAGQVEAFAAQAIVSAYGSNLASGPATATSPLPTTLNGTTVTITDSAGASRLAPLFYVSSSQVDFEIPEGTATGAATVALRSQNGGTQNANIQIGNVSPGIFQLNTSGLAAAWVLPVISGVQQGLQPVYRLDGSNNVVALPLSLGPPAEQIYLELYGTGIRNARTVTASVGGLSVPVLFAGAAPGYPGLDQVNIGPLPRALAGQGSAGIIVAADGQPANTVNLSIGQ